MIINNVKQKTSQYSNHIRFFANILIWMAGISLAFMLDHFSPLTFCTVGELFTVVIAFSAFIIVLNTHDISQNSFLTFFGIAFGFTAVFELLQLLIYFDADILKINNSGINLLLSIIPRLLLGLSILVSYVFIKRRINITYSITAFGSIIILVVSGLLYAASSFTANIENINLYPLTFALRVTAALIFTIDLILLFLNKKSLRYGVYMYMLSALLASIFSEVLLLADANIESTTFTSAYILKFIAFICIYKAIIQSTLRNPVDSIFGELQMVKNELVEKNYEISQTNEKLKREIDDLHTVEKLLRKSKAWSRSIFEGSPVGIALLTTNGYVIEANPALEKILGYSANELRNIGISNITHIDDIEDDSRYFDDLIEGNIDSYKIEKRYIRKDNKVIWANVKMSYIQNIGEDFQFIIAMIEDITQQKENEERQRQLVARLEETNKELDNFAYIVSHDLKAPLRGIGSLANWLLTDYKDKLNEEGADIINLLINRVERMKNFIDGILQYSRVTRVQENYVDIDLNKLVKEVIEMLAPPPNIEIKIKSPLPIIRGEVIYIEQLFQNLLSNAVKFMDKPEGKIEIKCTDAEDFWQFSIADNGPGIDEKYYNKIFMVFQTLQPRDKFESTGIGLSIVKKIIETIGGRIWLESELGQGTTFYFTLPKNDKQ